MNRIYPKQEDCMECGKPYQQLTKAHKWCSLKCRKVYRWKREQPVPMTWHEPPRPLSDAEMEHEDLMD